MHADERIRKHFESLVKNGSLHHGYLFFGTKNANIYNFAHSFACFLETGKFAIPERILSDTSTIANVEGTIGIDAMRAAKEFLWQMPNVSTHRTLIINEADTMTGEAQNAFLKVAEDAPKSALIIFITSDQDALWPTLRSRLHAVYFPPLSDAALPKNETYTPLATSYLKLTLGTYRQKIKEFVSRDEFHLNPFLDALISILTTNPKRHSQAWHAVLELRGKSAQSPLSPRIQLESLWISISKN